MGTTNVYSNTYQRIKIEINSCDTELARMVISSYDNLRGNINLIDSVLNGKKLSYEFLYKAPMLPNDSITVTLNISASDKNGYTQKTSRKLLILAKDYRLEELAGITLYTNEINDHPNGIYLEEMRPLIVSMADSATIDIYAYLDANTPEVLTQEWRSNTDIYFARANQFDYANATNRSVTEAFGNAIANPRISRISKDDIILIGRTNKAIGAIKVVQLYDDPGIENDRYIINIKKIN
ncbi:MAG: hypothetical protein NC388_09745 [Clostridium sp.]|nr:hypothetical protein [Clostridium sp.]